jgi:hypothetical protein
MSPILKFDTPHARIFRATRQTFKRRYNAGKVGISTWPVQQVKIEMVGAETGEARLTGTRNAITFHVIGPYFGDEEYVVALTSDHATDQFLGTTIAIYLRCVY